MAVQRPLSPWRPLPKFLCLKSIVFLCFWQSLALRWLAGLFLTGAAEGAAAPAAAAAAAAAAARLQDWLICIEMVPCAIAHLWAFPPWELEAFEKAEGHRSGYSSSSSSSSSSSNAAADEWSMLLRQGDHAAPAAAAADTYAATSRAAGPSQECENSSSSNRSSISSSSSSNSSKLKKPLKQLVNGVQQLLLSDTVLSDATHAVFGPQQQQREFNLETRSTTPHA
ncbi:ACR261Cp, related, related [Eimeria mitis]|uniref:ACR261Cp, related, related n=1 Tax=Eimeria mitis TaxID=44415 RepID=U6K2A0_9EIME|nr:ACR261Cp, related, related [Eimeria mitis]CDJ30442.1 ACR261Cp, related, related [Eimeria mitis]